MKVGLMTVGIATFLMYVVMGMVGPMSKRLIRVRDWQVARRESQTA
jgi:hypothetical protein